MEDSFRKQTIYISQQRNLSKAESQIYFGRSFLISLVLPYLDTMVKSKMIKVYKALFSYNWSFISGRRTKLMFTLAFSACLVRVTYSDKFGQRPNWYILRLILFLGKTVLVTCPEGHTSRKLHLSWYPVFNKSLYYSYRMHLKGRIITVTSL